MGVGEAGPQGGRLGLGVGGGLGSSSRGRGGPAAPLPLVVPLGGAPGGNGAAWSRSEVREGAPSPSPGL